MQVDTFFKLSDEFLQECKDIQIEKGREYTIDDGTGKADKFANFRSIGARLNLDPKMVLLVYIKPFSLASFYWFVYIRPLKIDFFAS